MFYYHKNLGQNCNSPRAPASVTATAVIYYKQIDRDKGKGEKKRRRNKTEIKFLLKDT